MPAEDFNTEYPPTWCPGCGDYSIWAALKEALVRLNFKPDGFVIVYGIGCSGNMNDFVKSYGFHALHGRAIPNAIGIRLANHKLPVICVVGDGDCYGEGGNHLIHAARGNFDITVLVHDNRVFGLTTGQASPTAEKGFESKSTPEGTIEVPVNPLSLAITQGATFVAQGFAGDVPHLSDLIVAAVKHKGFSLLNVLQPCVTFNKVNTLKWYQERVYRLDNGAVDGNRSRISRIEALKLVVDSEKIPLGVVYQERREIYEQSLPQLKERSLVEKKPHRDIENLLTEFL